MPKTFNEIKVGGKAAILGWHNDYGGQFSDDKQYYGMKDVVIRSITLYDLPPTKTGMIKVIQTSDGTTFSQVSKNAKRHKESTAFSDKTLYIDKEDILTKKAELKQREIEEKTKNLEELQSELEELKNLTK